MLRLGLASLLLLLPSLVAAGEPVVIRPAHGPAYRADQIFVLPKPGRAHALAKVHQQNGAKLLKSFPALGGVQLLSLPPGADAMEYVARYQRNSNVTLAHVDHWIEAAAIPNDPTVGSGTQWHLNNTGLNGGVPGADIHALTAWDTLHSASNIIVAVIDSGARLTHEDLAANLWVNPAETPGNGIDDDGNGFIDDIHGINAVTGTGSPDDDAGHGTHVAGILGAVGNNGVGVSGVAWQVQLMLCKFLSVNGGSESGLLTCLDYARSKGAKVINCSFVAPPSSISPTLSNAFVTVRDAGIIVVAAAGNTGADIDLDPQYPASFGLDNIVVVTATTRTDGFAGYSYGPNTVDLGAPGFEIYSTYFGFDSDYATISGTSMAAPCVSGAIALLRTRFPSLNYRQVIERVLATVDPLPSLAGRCRTGGRLNLARALGSGDLELRAAAFSWVPTNGMSLLTLSGDAVSASIPLPFTFDYFGQPRTAIFIGANGLLGFSDLGEQTADNTDIPQSTLPNGLICPFWDDLNPASGGQIWTGALGTAPNRKFVVSWVDVPHAVTTGGETRYTFQAILHETGDVTFQYLQVQSGRNTLVSGKSATVGLEDDTGLVGVRYSYNGSPSLLTNRQAILFAPRGAALQPPSLDGVLSGASDYSIVISAQPASRCVLSASSDLLNWLPLSTNLIPASGFTSFQDHLATAVPRFYRVENRP